MISNVVEHGLVNASLCGVGDSHELQPRDYQIFDQSRRFRWIYLVSNYPTWGADNDVDAENVLIGYCDSPDQIPGVDTGEIVINQFEKPLVNEACRDHPFTHVLIIQDIVLGSEACKWVEQLFCYSGYAMPFAHLACLLPHHSQLRWSLLAETGAAPVLVEVVTPDLRGCQ